MSRLDLLLSALINLSSPTVGGRLQTPASGCGVALSSAADVDLVRARSKIKLAITRAGALAQVGRLRDAIDLLNHPSLLENSGYVREQATIHQGVAPESNERAYAARLHYRSFVTACVEDQKVCFPSPPVATGANLLWAQRAWLQVAAEELGHVAQRIGRLLHPQRSFLSQMLSGNTTSHLQQTILSQNRVHGYLRRPGWMSADLILDEADIYAFLVESFGSEFIPAWIGLDSGYSVRILIDQEFTRRGVPRREWTALGPALRWTRELEIQAVAHDLQYYVAHKTAARN